MPWRPAFSSHLIKVLLVDMNLAKRARSPLVGSVGRIAPLVFCLVSLVSVWGENWCYSCGIVEGVETVETVGIASIDAVFMQVAENTLGYQTLLGQYPTPSPTSF